MILDEIGLKLIPALDRHFAFHPTSLVMVLSINSRNVVVFGLFWKTGHLKYFLSESLWVILKIPAATCLWYEVALDENVSVVLW